MTWAEVSKKKFTTASAICAAVRKRVRYRKDTNPKAPWKPAAVTWFDRHGDCEDFAVLVMELCRLNGIGCEISLLFQGMSGEGHAIANGGKWWASNGRYYTTSDKVKAVARELGWDAAKTWIMMPPERVIEAQMT